MLIILYIFGLVYLIHTLRKTKSWYSTSEKKTNKLLFIYILIIVIITRILAFSTYFVVFFDSNLENAKFYISDLHDFFESLSETFNLASMMFICYNWSGFILDLDYCPEKIKHNKRIYRRIALSILLLATIGVCIGDFFKGSKLYMEFRFSIVAIYIITIIWLLYYYKKVD